MLARLVPATAHPLRVYAFLELGIGAMGLLIWAGYGVIGEFYTAFGHGSSGIFMRGVVSVICLLPPTVLMGATLPAISRWVETTPKGVSWLGLFYAGNIGGAVAGCLVAGFYLLRVYDMGVTTYVAVAINVTVALSALGLAAATPHTHGARDSRRQDPQDPRRGGVVDLPGHRALRLVRLGGGSRVDSDDLAAAGRHRLYVLHHPGRVSVRVGDRQQRGGVS